MRSLLPALLLSCAPDPECWVSHACSDGWSVTWEARRGAIPDAGELTAPEAMALVDEHCGETPGTR